MMNGTAPRKRFGFPVLEVLGLLLLLGAAFLLITQLSNFSALRQRMPQGLVLGEVPVSGLSLTEAKATVESYYGNPVTVNYQDQIFYLYPDEVGFIVNSDAMLSKADELRTEGTFWAGFWDFLWQRPEQEFSVELDAEFSPEMLATWVDNVANRYDRPALPATADFDTMQYFPGEPGYKLDKEEAVAVLSEALMKPVQRTVSFDSIETEAPEPTLETLGTVLTEYLVTQEYQGVASIYIIDETTGENLQLDVDMRQGTPFPVSCDIAYAGLSTMKIPMTVEYYRYLSWVPFDYEFEVVTLTLEESSNLMANVMLRTVSGTEDDKRGARIVTDSMWYLGLENSFIAVGYDDESEDVEYFSTPAREAARNGVCIDTKADYAMQTTAEDIAVLMDMIYQCYAYGGGGLVAAYGDDITQSECSTILDVMSNNFNGPLIRSGLPEGTKLSHKHGFTSDTMSDAGVVFSPGGDYVLVIFLYQDVWIAPIAFPLMQGISSATFDYFNPDLVGTPRQGYGDLFDTEG